jgi:Xaa-Pro aminopeptidase
VKSDIDAIMQANNVDVLLVVGPGQHNPSMVYFTGGGHLTGADLIKKRGEPPVLFHGSMERDEAAKTGLATRSYSLYPLSECIKEANGDRVQGAAIRYKRMFSDLGISAGRVALYGQVDMSTAWPVFSALRDRMPEITLGGDVGGAILGKAMMTKDEAEIEHIRRMGKITTEVVGMVADYLTSQKVGDGETLTGPDGQPVTIGRVKGLINLWLSERGAENPEGTIFSIGHDAGVPHSSGEPEQAIRLGQPIVFDIFPCEAGGGYFYDFTRTWCLGYAPDAVQGIYEQVQTVFNTVLREMKPGERFYEYQKLTCDMFEEMGHPTVQNQPETEEGYVHSLGHGLGLRVHERPFSGSTASREDILAPGSIVTVEPGLYYPERGLGVRLEDTVCVRADGTIEVLAEYPKDLVLKMKK